MTMDVSDPIITSNYPAFMEWVFKGMATVLFSVGAWLGVSMKNDIKSAKNSAIDAKDYASDVKDELSAHKLNISENYVKSNTLERLHGRLDTIEGDIKELLSRRQ